jgi:histidinol-phosphatase (PHP family)
VVRSYLAELERMASSTEHFDVMAHVDFALRYLPDSARPFDLSVVEPEYRAALEALARSGRAMEVNTKLPMTEQIVRWWHDVGGPAVTFGSDAHRPGRLAHRFAETMAMVEAIGFRPDRDPIAPWRRT